METQGLSGFRIPMLFASKKPKKEWIVCPVCSHEQKDYVEANATFCHACGHRISLKEKGRVRRKNTRKKVDKRMVPCMHCGQELEIHTSALSWQCTGCSSYLDLSNHEVNKDSGADIMTYGNITVGKKGFLGGAKAEAETVFMSGKAKCRLICRNALIVRDQVSLLNETKGKLMRVVAGSELKATALLEFQDIEIAGTVSAPRLVVRGQLRVEPGGFLKTDSLMFGSIEVEPGGKLFAPARSLREEKAVSPGKADEKSVPDGSTGMAEADKTPSGDLSSGPAD